MQINNTSTKHGLDSATLLSEHIFTLAQSQSLELSQKQEKAVLRQLGMSAVSSKGDKRQANVLRALDNAMSSRIVSVGQSVELEPWQDALDQRMFSVIAARDQTHSDDLAQITQLWRETSPFTKNRDGTLPQYELQMHGHPALQLIADEVQAFLRSHNIHEVTLYKALRFENDNQSVPLSLERPKWYRMPSPDRSEDGFDEEFLRKATLPAKQVLLSRFTGFTTDKTTATQMARWTMEGTRSRYYAVLSGTFPVESIISIPTIGIGALSKLECVVDASAIDTGSFNLMLGARA